MISSPWSGTRYIAWPRPKLEQWMSDYFDLARIDIDPATWMRWCDWMGLQRNFKIVGIFARLHYRDEESGIPGNDSTISSLYGRCHEPI